MSEYWRTVIDPPEEEIDPTKPAPAEEEIALCNVVDPVTLKYPDVLKPVPE